MPAIKRPKLGSHLEWHGATIRVVVRVSPKLVPVVGKNKLKEPLRTSTPRDAEVPKWPVIARLKGQLTGANGKRTDDPLVADALMWREAIKADAGSNGVTARD